MFEVVTRWGDTVLDIALVDRDYAIGTRAVVRRGAVVGESAGCVGCVEYAVRRVARGPRTLPFARICPIEHRRTGVWLTISLLAHLALWGFAHEYGAPYGSPPSARRLVTRSVQARSFADAPATLVHRTSDDESDDDRDPGRGSPLALPAGAAGIANHPRDRGHIELARHADEPDLARALEHARRAGVLGSQALASETFAAVTGTGDLTSGFDHSSVSGPVLGGDGAAAGAFGLARTNNQSGACLGSDCSGLIGTGRYGTLGHGHAIGEGWGGSRPGADGLGRARGHEAKVPTVVICGKPGCWRADGELDKMIIRRYLRRAMAKLTYCYEKQLLVEPALRTSLELEFLIAADGHVASAAATGGDAAVSACVAEVVEAIEFPKAHSPTLVHYPLFFDFAGA